MTVELIRFGYQISLEGVEHFLKYNSSTVNEYLMYFHDPKDLCSGSTNNIIHGKVSLLWSAARATHMNKDDRYKVIQVLLKSGADSFFRSRLGWTPYDVAKRYAPGEVDALNLLWRPSLLSFVTFMPWNNGLSRTSVVSQRISLGHTVASALDVHPNRTVHPFICYSKFNTFQDVINRRAAKHTQGSTLLLNVFVHGLDVSFEEALASTARLSHLMEDEMINIVFSWDKCGDDLVESALRAVGYFADFIIKLNSAFKEKKINLFGHGMGSRIVLFALQDLLRDGVHSVRAVIISSPDMDQLTLQTAMEHLQQRITENRLLENAPFFALLCPDRTFPSRGKCFRSHSARCLPRADGCVTFLVQNAKEYDDNRVTDPALLYLIAYLFHFKPSKTTLRQRFDNSLSNGLDEEAIITLQCDAFDLSNHSFEDESVFSWHGPSNDALSYREQHSIVLDGDTSMSDYREVTETPEVFRPKKPANMFAGIACGILIVVILAAFVGGVISANQASTRESPSQAPASNSTIQPTRKPTINPNTPTIQPSTEPTFSPTAPTPIPTNHPTTAPTLRPTSSPSFSTSRPTPVPTATPTPQPTAKPTAKPTATPTAAPTALCNSVSYNPTAQQCCNGNICSLSDHCYDCGCFPQDSTNICCSDYGLKKVCANTDMCCYHLAGLNVHGALSCCAPGTCTTALGC